MSVPLILSLDQGTTSTRAIVFDDTGSVRATAQQELTQHYPRPGWVEHDPDEIRRAVIGVCRDALDRAGGEVAAIGITNQRETCVLWDARTGAALCRAIVWQDRRTAHHCADLREKGLEPEVTRRTGLLLDPYFSATKIAWMLDNIADARDRAERGEILAGTMDTFVLWHLTGGRVHATDATNASRTLLYNIHDNDWDPWLLDLFDIPAGILPEVRDCAADYGVTDPACLGRAIPITGIAGDQQAATVGQACFRPGMVKSTYGTGAFMMLNTGHVPAVSRNRLLTTIAYRLEGRTSYALEGSIFNAGSTVQWLRDRLRIISDAGETEALAGSLEDNRGVYLVPAFTGLGAPHWQPEARGLMRGLTRDTGAAEIARAALEAVAYQTRDLIEAMDNDFPVGEGGRHVLRADGGMTVNHWMMQFIADMLAVPVDTPGVVETTSLGAAFLAGLHVGIFQDLDDIALRWRRAHRFEPSMPADVRDHAYAGWRAALECAFTAR